MGLLSLHKWAGVRHNIANSALEYLRVDYL